MHVVAGGKERTKEQFALLLKNAGFNLNRVYETRSLDRMVEASPIPSFKAVVE